MFCEFIVKQYLFDSNCGMTHVYDLYESMLDYRRWIEWMPVEVRDVTFILKAA